MALHHIAIEKTANQIQTIRSGATAEDSLWYYDTDNDLLYYTRISDNKLIGPIGARQIITLERTLLTSGDDTRSIGEFPAPEGVNNLTIIVESNDATFRHAAIYHITRHNIATTAWETLVPISGTGTDNDQWAALQAKQNASAELELRLKRLGNATDELDCTVRIFNNAAAEVGFTESNSFGTDGTTQDLSTLTPITQLSGKVGVFAIPGNSDIDIEVAKNVYFHDHLSIGWPSPGLGNNNEPYLSLWSSGSSTKDNLQIATHNSVLYSINSRTSGFNKEIFVDSGNFKKTYERRDLSTYGSPYVNHIARASDGSGTIRSIFATEIAFQWSSYNSDILRLYGDGRIEASKYVNTLDDTGTSTPANFLYSGSNGEFYSAPFGRNLGNVSFITRSVNTSVGLTNNTLYLIEVADNIDANVDLPSSSLTKGDRVWIRFDGSNTNNTLTVHAGSTNSIDGSLGNVTVPKGGAVLFIWFGSGSSEQWHRMAEFT